MIDPPQIGRAVVQSLSSQLPVDVFQEWLEFGIDSTLPDGLIRDVPVVNTIVALAKVGISIRDRLLIGKILKFLYQAHSISAETRIAMVRKLESDPEYGRKVGEHVIELLERIESERKPEMLAIVFKAYAASEIDANMLNRLNNAIERIPIFDIHRIRPFRDADPIDRLKMEPTFLVNAGLATVHSGWGGLVFKPNDVCEKFLHLDLDRCLDNCS